MSVLQSAHEADALDLRTLCAAIDEFPGIVTTCSYQDLVGGHRPGTSWTVHFSCGEAPTRQGYASLEFLVWLQREARAAGFSDLFVGVNAPPPYLNSALPLLLPALFEGSPGRARNPHPRPAPQAVHSSISQRPTSRGADTLWDIGQIVQVIEAYASKPGKRGPYKKRLAA